MWESWRCFKNKFIIILFSFMIFISHDFFPKFSFILFVFFYPFFFFPLFVFYFLFVFTFFLFLLRKKANKCQKNLIDSLSSIYILFSCCFSFHFLFVLFCLMREKEVENKFNHNQSCNIQTVWNYPSNIPFVLYLSHFLSLPKV